MSDFVFWLYWISVLSSANFLLSIVFTASATAFLFFVIFTVALVFGAGEKETSNKIRKMLRASVVAMVVSGFTLCFIPGDKYLYSMIALKATPQIRQSQEYKKVIELIDSFIENNKEDKE